MAQEALALEAEEKALAAGGLLSVASAQYVKIWREEQARQCHWLRDIFGNPWRPLVVEPTWLNPKGGVVSHLARDIYEQRRFDELPVLADALEEAGCTNQGILTHCRAGGEHVRGCWVIDLLLGKT
jgi:hypothetical protein